MRPTADNTASRESALTFDQVYGSYFEFVWRSLRRLGVSDADVADTAQEVFVIVHRRLAEFEGRARITTWLFRICLNVARDRAERQRVRREVFDPTSLEQLVDPALDAESALAHHDALRLLESALERLDVDHRAVFTLFELDGLTCVQIAETLELPLGTVYSRLRRAREVFQKAISRQLCSAQPLLATEGT